MRAMLSQPEPAPGETTFAASLVDEMERDKKFSKDVEAKLHDLVKDFKKSGAY